MQWMFRSTRSAFEPSVLSVRAFVLLLGLALFAAPCGAADVMRAQDFVETIGVQTHLRFANTSYRDISQVLSSMSYLGVTHARDLLPMPDNPFYRAFAQAAKAGIRFDLLVQSPDIAKGLDNVAKLQTQYPGSVALIEGPNEVNHNKFVTFGGLTGREAALPYQAALYEAVKAHPVLGKLLVVGFTDYPYRWNQCDLSNAHPYPKKGVQPFLYNRGEFSTIRRAIADKPIIVTETGYYTLPGPFGWGGVDEDTQAKYLINTLFDNIVLGVTRTYIYELLDQRDDPQMREQELHFGLFDRSYRPKPAATGIRNLIALMKDSGPDAASFVLQPPKISVAGLPETAKTLSFQKSDGTTIIVLWNEPPIWDPRLFRSIPYEPVKVTIALDRARSFVVYDPISSDQPLHTYESSQQVTIALGDKALLIAVK